MLINFQGFLLHARKSLFLFDYSKTDCVCQDFPTFVSSLFSPLSSKNTPFPRSTAFALYSIPLFFRSSREPPIIRAFFLLCNAKKRTGFRSRRKRHLRAHQEKGTLSVQLPRLVSNCQGRPYRIPRRPQRRRKPQTFLYQERQAIKITAQEKKALRTKYPKKLTLDNVRCILHNAVNVIYCRCAMNTRTEENLVR